MFIPAYPARNPAINIIRGELTFSDGECDQIRRSADEQGWREGKIGTAGPGTVTTKVRSMIEQRLPVDPSSGFPLLRILSEICRLNSSLWYFDLTGFVPDDELRHLLSGATALVLPSENEGFGLPAVEAAACGTPVIATTASPLPELLEGGGIFVAPRDDVSLIAAMRSLATNRELRCELGARAYDRASVLTWAKSARSALAAVYEAAA